jgi:hypothetical protein
MSHFVRLTSANDPRLYFFVNLNQVTHIYKEEGGVTTVCVSGREDVLAVTQTPEQVLAASPLKMPVG